METAQALRAIIRKGEFAAPTAGRAPGYVQTNLVILDRQFAFEFLLFCLKNPKPLPLIGVSEPGDFSARAIANVADVRTDVPLYRFYEEGTLSGETDDIQHAFNDDSVAFYLGCSFTFETALEQAGIEVRHITEGVNVPMFRTSIDCEPVGPFAGPLVVSMRPIAAERIAEAVAITGKFPLAHGEPVHIGDPAAIGILDISSPDYGDAVTIKEGEIPVFWACGVTSQAALKAAALPQVITHAPGHMFVTDVRDRELEGQHAFLDR